MFKHVFGLFISPQKEWLEIRKKLELGKCKVTPLVLILGLIPPVSGFIGTTQFGWQIGTAEAVKLSHNSALPIAIAYYIAIVAGIFLIGLAIQWMGSTYIKEVGTTEAGLPEVGLPESVTLAAFVSVPLLLIGIFEIYPILWLNFLVGLVALGYSVYLLYSGLPVLLAVPDGKGFLYASAVLGFGMVALVTLLVLTALFWGVGLEPQFVR